MILTIAQAPNSNGSNVRPLSGRSGRRLARILGLDLDDMLAQLHPVNLLSRFYGKSGKGDAFPPAEARRAAEQFDLGNADAVVLLGHGVAAAFGYRGEYLRWFELRGRRAIVVPHPSGVSRWYNDPANVERVQALFQDKTLLGSTT